MVDSPTVVVAAVAACRRAARRLCVAETQADDPVLGEIEGVATACKEADMDACIAAFSFRRSRSRRIE